MIEYGRTSTVLGMCEVFQKYSDTDRKEWRGREGGREEGKDRPAAVP